MSKLYEGKGVIFAKSYKIFVRVTLQQVMINASSSRD